MERRSFQYFRERTALELSGFFDGHFWNKLILQTAQADSAIRHCLVAIASLHESLTVSYDAGYENPLSGGPGAKQRQFSLQQYNRAISQLTLNRGEKPIALDLVLLACVLFICYENFESHYSNAVIHMENGLRILESLKQAVSDRVYHDVGTLESLTSIFLRLQHQYARFLDAHSPTITTPAIQFPTPMECLSEPQLPASFADIYEARRCLDTVISWEMTTTLPLFGPGDPFYRRRILETIESALAKWHSRFDQLVERLRHRQDLDFQWAAITIKSHATVATILPYTMPATSESIYNDFTSKFAFLVAEAKRLNAMGYRDRISSTRKVTFGFDLGITPVLFLVASRCRDPYLRRTAIEQLRACRRREGAWDSATAARIAERIMAIEEAGISPLRTCHDVPESHRIRLLSTDAHPHNGRIRSYFVRAPYDLEISSVEEDCFIWDSSKPTFEEESSQIQFWNSIYCNTFSANTAQKDTVPTVGFPKKMHSASASPREDFPA